MIFPETGAGWADSQDVSSTDTDDAVPAVRQAQVAAGLAQLKAADPAFDVDRFLDLARTCFLRVKQAWQERDMTPVEGYLAQGLNLTLSAQVQQMRRQRIRNVLADLQLLDQHIAEAGTGDHLTLRFDFQAAHFALEEAGNLVFGDRERKAFAEYWFFVRPPGAKSYGSPDTSCLTCGAPLSPDGRGRCRYCRSVLAGGAMGWRVSAIKEEVEWSA